MKKVVIHTDGACEGNPGPGGWGAILEYGTMRREISGADPATTNNRMELEAAIRALEALNQACEIECTTDSQYVRKGVTEWIRGWRVRGWLTKSKEPVKNEDLWRKLDGLCQKHKVTWHWVKGHSGHPLNERCDALAVAAIAALKRTMPSGELKARLAEFKRGRAVSEREQALF